MEKDSLSYSYSDAQGYIERLDSIREYLNNAFQMSYDLYWKTKEDDTASSVRSVETYHGGAGADLTVFYNSMCKHLEASRELVNVLQEYILRYDAVMEELEELLVNEMEKNPFLM